jgi:hypothetical protein
MKKVRVIGFDYSELTLSASLIEYEFEVSEIEIRKNALDLKKKSFLWAKNQKIFRKILKIINLNFQKNFLDRYT